MINWQPNDFYAENIECAIQDLAHALYRGELSVFLGAGVSKPLGLPSWWELIRRCLKKAKLPHTHINAATSNSDLRQEAGHLRRHIKDDIEYCQLVSDCLYIGAKDPTKEPTPLLLSLGAMLMGSRRGRVSELWTLNYDDMVERYLRMNGFVSQVVDKIPCLLRLVDVTVYHPHGFLPSRIYDGTASSEIVLDDTSYAKSSVGVNQPMREVMRNLIASKILLAIGLSWSEDTLNQLLMDIAPSITKRPSAFWFFGPNATASECKACLAHNVVPLKFRKKDFSDFAPFLHGICEGSMSFASLNP